MTKEELYKTIIDKSGIGVYCVNRDRQIYFWNKAAEKITGYSEEEMVGIHCYDTHLDHIDQDGHPLCKLMCPLVGTMFDANPRRNTVLVRRKDDTRIAIEVHTEALYEDGEIVGAIEFFSEEPAVQFDGQLMKHLSDVAMHDELTRLPNRTYINSYIDYKLEQLRHDGKPFVLAFADIDNFRLFNDSYGHLLGDQILLEISEVMRRNVRKDDLIGRWGGEEFIGIFANADEQDELALGKRFQQWFKNAEVLNGQTHISITVSIGITAARPEDTLDTLIKRADELMFLSKKKGKDQFHTDYMLYY